MKEAMFFSSHEEGAVECELCPQHCRIGRNGRGSCGVRENQEGKLFSLVYGKMVASNIDPIEKKPLFHFFPGSLSYSIATVGCNLHCRHCQNSDISQMPIEEKKIIGRFFKPEAVVALAQKGKCHSISYTYTEPTVYFEFAYDTAKLADKAGLKNVFVSNGYVSPEPIMMIQPYLHGANIDLKSFRESFYRKVCKARLEPVLDTIRLIKKLGIWLEITTLLIPGLNDDTEELKDIACFIKDLDLDIPWHVSAFHPTYKMTDRPRTPIESLRKAWEIGKAEGLRFVYTGNIPGEEGENTYCPFCGKCIIRRFGFRVISLEVDQGLCRHCGKSIPIMMD